MQEDPRTPPALPPPLRECVPGAAWDQNRWRIGSVQGSSVPTRFTILRTPYLKLGPEGAPGRPTTEDIHQHQRTFALFSRSFLGIFSPRLYSVAGTKLSPDSPPLRQPAAVTNKSYYCFDLVFFSFSFFLSLFQVDPNRKQCRRVKA